MCVCMCVCVYVCVYVCVFCVCVCLCVCVCVCVCDRESMCLKGRGQRYNNREGGGIGVREKGREKKGKKGEREIDI